SPVSPAVKLIRSVLDARSRARWGAPDEGVPCLELSFIGARLATINDLLGTLSLRQRMAYKHAWHGAVQRATPTLEPAPAGFTPPFLIHVTRYSPREPDRDNLNAKYLVD